LVGMAAFVALIVVHQRRNQQGDIYEPIAAWYDDIIIIDDDVS
jgi:hypothetical protein